MGRRSCRSAGWRLAALLLATALGSSPAFAICTVSGDTDIRQLQTLVYQDGTRAVKQAEARIASMEGTRAAAQDPHLLALLYAVQARGYNILELDDEAKKAALQGIKLVPDPADAVYVDLLTTYAENIYDSAGIEAVLKSIDAAQAHQVHGSLADTCLLITRGLLQSRQERPDLAFANLIEAYNASKGPEFAEARILAAESLSSAMRVAGDYPQALALNQETIDWYTQRNAVLSLSVSRFLRGKILNLMGRYDAAIEEFTAARLLSIQVNDTQGVAFADLLACTARVELGQLERAASACNNALHVFLASHSTDQVKETRALLARIDLANGHAERALNTLDGVLDQGGAGLLPGRVASLYLWRARANAALHNYRDAYDDLAEYARRNAAANDAERSKQAAALRARFQIDREIERNVLLKRELGISQEHAQRQARELRWNAIVATLGVAVIALLIYFLFVNRRYRQQLLRLASTDCLTGLPNRRRTAEIATAALAGTSAANPLTIAIIDMDHFKVINDRCGHATGDYVLKEFARIGRETLRESDVLGRWGGEEFLLIMPAATLELAIASVERMRTLVYGIRLPASGAGLQVSLSAGLATGDQNGRTLDEMIARADAALYVAKNEGRDLVRAADEGFLSTTAIRRAIRQ